MKPLRIAFLLLAAALLPASQPTDTHTAGRSCHPDQATPVRHETDGAHGRPGEHAAVLALVSDCATSVAVRSGAWSDPGIWRDRQIPATDARVLIPYGVAVDVDRQFDAQALDWIKVAGRLAFRPDRNTALAMQTVVVTGSGSLQIGSAAAPIDVNARAQLLFAPRTVRNRRNDPYDLGGGLIALGRVDMAGAGKSAHVPAQRLSKGLSSLTFDGPPVGWKVGDQLLIPGTDAFDDQDEVRTVAATTRDEREIALDRPLNFDHVAPSGTSIPVGNLTRNIDIRSLAASPLQARGHVMFMHSQTGVSVDGVAFLNLGRTDANHAHTFPSVGPDRSVRPGTDTNTIGRYAVHFHVMSGARVNVPPHVVRNSVVVGSPKYGIVNHGGHVLAEDNVTYQISGSHFVAENSSEIGAFRRNMAVRSSGSGEFAVENRMSIYDFGHGGHGFWLHSGGVELTDNWASGHTAAAIFSMGMPFREQGNEIRFDARNLPGGGDTDAFSPIMSSEVSFHHARNLVAGSGKGLEVWYHKIYAVAASEYSVVDGLTVWNVAEQAVAIPYSRSLMLRNLRLHGLAKPAAPGISVNELTERVIIDGAEIRNFAEGIVLPDLGRNVVRNATLANPVNLRIGVGLHKGRQVHLDNVAFEPAGEPGNLDILMGSSAFRGDAVLLFAENRVDLTDEQGRNQRLYFPFQAAGAIPFQSEGPAALRGLTSEAIQRAVGIAPGGSLAPGDAAALPRSNALAALSPRPTADTEAAFTRRETTESYPEQSRHFLEGAGTEERRPASAHTTTSNDPRNPVVNINNNPTKFMLRRGLLPLAIHPDDIAYGYRAHGVVLDKVDAQLIMRNWEREFHDLGAGGDGFVRIAFNITSLAGADVPVELALRVTPDAVRRDRNVDFYLQRAFCGTCGNDTLQKDAETFYETGLLEPLRHIAACKAGAGTRIPLHRPFGQDNGRAYVSVMHDLKDNADNLQNARRSPFSLCEGDRALPEAHSLHDAIRRFGRGRYSHWGHEVYFSSLDGSDPNTNGRDYYLVRSD